MDSSALTNLRGVENACDPMKQWYYSKDDEQQGPVSEDELRRMLDSSQLPQNTLVWTDGQMKWEEAEKLFGLAISPYAAPSAQNLTDVNWDGYTPDGPQCRPWVRYWARTLDFLIFSLLAGGLIGYFAPEAVIMPEVMFELVLLLAYNFVEPAMFALWGNTPIKAFFRIRVRNQQGLKLSYGEALRRNFHIWIRGNGMGIPLVSLFTLISSYSQLSNRGITPWDANGGFRVSHQKVEWWRWVLFFGIFVTLFGVLIFLSFQDVSQLDQ